MAVIVLRATPFQVGLLGTLSFLPSLLFSVPAGMLIDRWSKRATMLGAGVLKSLTLTTIPLAFYSHNLHIEQLYVTSFSLGTLGMFSDVAAQSWLPTLIDKRQLTGANSQLQAASSVSGTTGPAAAGFLVQALGAPLSLALDLLFFAVSAGAYLGIRAAGVAPSPTQPEPFWSQVRGGFGFVFRSPVLVSLALCSATGNLGIFAAQAVAPVFAYRQLGLSAGQMGLVNAVAAVGLFGVLFSGHLQRRLGVGCTLALAQTVGAIGMLCAPLAGWRAALPLFAVSCAVVNLGTSIYGTNQVSLRQSVIPLQMQGRVNATMRMLILGSVPLAQLAGGALGELIGIRPAMLLGGSVALLAPFWLFLGPVGRIRDFDDARLLAPPPSEEAALLAA